MHEKRKQNVSREQKKENAGSLLITLERIHYAAQAAPLMSTLIMLLLPKTIHRYARVNCPPPLRQTAVAFGLALRVEEVEAHGGTASTTAITGVPSSAAADEPTTAQREPPPRLRW